MPKKTSDAQLKAIQKYDAKNTKQYHLKLNLKTDAEMIAWLDSKENFQGYIKDLVKHDMPIACDWNK